MALLQKYRLVKLLGNTNSQTQYQPIPGKMVNSNQKCAFHSEEVDLPQYTKKITENCETGANLKILI